MRNHRSRLVHPQIPATSSPRTKALAMTRITRWGHPPSVHRARSSGQSLLRTIRNSSPEVPSRMKVSTFNSPFRRPYPRFRLSWLPVLHHRMPSGTALPPSPLLLPE